MRKLEIVLAIGSPLNTRPLGCGCGCGCTGGAGEGAGEGRNSRNPTRRLPFNQRNVSAGPLPQEGGLCKAHWS